MSTGDSIKHLIWEKSTWIWQHDIMMIFQFQEMSTTAAVWGVRHREWWPTVIIPLRESEWKYFATLSENASFWNLFQTFFFKKDHSWSMQKFDQLRQGLLCHQRLFAKRKTLICKEKPEKASAWAQVLVSRFLCCKSLKNLQQKSQRCRDCVSPLYQ